MSSLPKNPVWFITGCSSGFGLSLSLLALRNGHKVIATSRKPSNNPDAVSQVEKLGGTWMELDVCSPDATSVLDKATAIHGRVDVLVNNAGYALLGAFETFTYIPLDLLRVSRNLDDGIIYSHKSSDAECRAQFETNFFAPLALCRHVIPAMRSRRSGIIINISSTAGIEARSSRSMYSGSKFALEAFSEALYDEMKPFGVRVLLVEPGAFRSSFSNKVSISGGGSKLPKDYEGTTLGTMMKYIETLQGGKSPGDVEKGCQAIFDVAMNTGQAEGMEKYLRLPLGKDGSERWKLKLANLQRTLDATEVIWSKTDHEDVVAR